MLSIVVLALIVTIPVIGALLGNIDPPRERRVSSRVRVAVLRERFRNADPGEEIGIRPDALWTLSVEMIMEVATDEGFRFCRDTIEMVGQTAHKAIVFVATAPGGHRC